MGRKVPLGLVSGLVLAVIAGVSAWGFRPHFAGESDPSAAGATPFAGPWVIPQQVVFDNEAGDASNPAAPEEARGIWRQALDNFRSAPDKQAALTRTEPLLREIWTRWPDTEYGIRAQIFAIETLGAYLPNSSVRRQAVEYVGHALRFPRIYFSDEWQATSQSIAASAVRWLGEDGQAAEAWRLCLGLRWGAPRIGILAPACRETIARHPEVKLTPEAMLAVLPSSVAIHKLESEVLKGPLGDGIRQYVADPYDADFLERMKFALWKAKIRKEIAFLNQELLGLNPEMLWRHATR